MDAIINGQEMLQAIEKQIYDLILMDILMPKMDGLVAAGKLVGVGQHYVNPKS